MLMSSRRLINVLSVLSSAAFRRSTQNQCVSTDLQSIDLWHRQRRAERKRTRHDKLIKTLSFRNITFKKSCKHWPTELLTLRPRQREEKSRAREREHDTINSSKIIVRHITFQGKSVKTLTYRLLTSEHHQRRSAREREHDTHKLNPKTYRPEILPSRSV